MKYLTTLCLLLLSSPALAVKPVADGLEAHDSWVREAPPNAQVMAAYLTLHNHSPKTRTLISLSSPSFQRVEMHRTEQHDGMTKMLAVSRVMLNRNGSVSFQPGGMHLMLIKPKKRYVTGDTISLTLIFADESTMMITVPVKKGTGNDGHTMQHGEHKALHDNHHAH